MTTAFSSALNRTGRPMWLNFHCLGPWAPWCAAQGNSWRIGPDHHDSYDSLKTVIAILGSKSDHSDRSPFVVSLIPKGSHDISRCQARRTLPLDGP